MLAINKKYVKVISLILISIFILTNTTVYAQPFTDVPDTHWAKEYIEKMNNLGIIKGKSEDKFAPSDNITRSEAIVMMSRLLSVNSDIVSKAREEYQSFLNEVGIQSWFQDGISVALASGIVSEDTVRTFRTDGKDNLAQRDEICIYLTRTMGLEEEANSKTVFFPKFEDAMLISTKAMKYIEVMVDKGIVNATGDSEGRFNPKSPITRAEIAKMLSIAYDVMKSDNTSASVPTVPSTDDNSDNEKSVMITGTVSSIMRATDMMYITVEDKSGDKVAYTIDSSSDIIIGDEELDYSELYISYKLLEGVKITAKVTEDFKIISLDAAGISEKYTGGYIRSILKGTPTMLTIEYEVENGKSTDTEEKAFYVDEDAEITLDGEDAYVSQLDKGDKVDFKVENSRIVEIYAESEYLEIEGSIVEVMFNPLPVLLIEDEDGERYKFEIDSKARIERNNKRAQISDLRKVDKVKIEVEYSIITEIDAEVVEIEDEGSIQSIFISNSPELTIKNKDGEISTYTISKDVDIEIDRKDSDIYGLRLGYYAELEIEGSEIVAIDAEAREQSEKYEGVVESVISKSDIIVITVPNNTTDEEEVITIYVTDDTTILAPDGSKARISDIEIGDEILVMGSSDGSTFTANSVLITGW